MALCLAESLLERQTFDVRDQMDRYVHWWHEGHLSSTGRCFDIGNTVKAALARYEKDGNPLAGSTDPDTSGNGSLMRLAPVVMFYASEPRIAVERAGESSRTTHGSRIAIDACRYFAALLLGAFDGVDKETLLSPHYTPVAGLWNEQPLALEIANVANGSFRRGPPEVQGTGYVAQTLEAALWAFDTTADFRAACLAAANLGQDADTTAAVCGQIAGAYYGVARHSAGMAGAAGNEGADPRVRNAACGKREQPLARGLHGASAEDLQDVIVYGGGSALRWESLDVDLAWRRS
jgi:ADP-ribosylglycohydrolase